MIHTSLFSNYHKHEKEDFFFLHFHSLWSVELPGGVLFLTETQSGAGGGRKWFLQFEDGVFRRCGPAEGEGRRGQTEEAAD